MLYNTSLVDLHASEALKIALQTAQEDRDLPLLDPGHKLKSFELYLGEQTDRPAYAAIDGQMVAIDPPTNPLPIIMAIGDDGRSVYVEVNGEIKLDRRNGAQFPGFGLGVVGEILEGAIVG
ncbi:MAG: hypothetical protein ACRCYP_01755 [Alphaproteobacteria bacterium]